MADMARALGVTYMCVYRSVRAHETQVAFARAQPGMPSPKDTARAERVAKRVARIERMVSMYRQGLTLSQIGEKFGLTGERVRKLMSETGITRVDGGGHKRREANRSVKQATQDARCLARWGMPYADYAKLRDAGVTRPYCQQERNAIHRGIAWRLKLAQWWSIWESSGKWELRGRRKGGYVMSRIHDSGCYETGNVHVQLLEENSLEAVKQWHGKTKEARGVFLVLPGTKRPYLAKVGRKSLGYFATEAEGVQARTDFALANGYRLTADGRLLKQRAHSHPSIVTEHDVTRVAQTDGSGRHEGAALTSGAA